MGTRTPYSKLRIGDTVRIEQSGFQIPQWAVGMEGKVETINREGGIVVNLGYNARRKYLTAKREQLILIRGKNYVPGGKAYDENGVARDPRKRRQFKRKKGYNVS